MPEREIALFLCREPADVALRAIDALRAACAHAGGQSTIHLLINGNPALGAALAALVDTSPSPDDGVQVCAWSLPLADKAAAWNGYVHEVSAEARYQHFVDGYALLHTDALARLEAALAGDDSAWAAAGVPTAGRSAPALRAAMLRHGGLHGNFHALRGTVLGRLRDAGIRLPLGLYRVDGVVGALLCFALDPARHPWQSGRIHVVDGASWDVAHAGPRWHPRELAVMWRRRLRQAQGRLENAAIHQFLAVEQRPPAQLPGTVEQLVGDWAQAQPAACSRVLARDPLCRLALARLRAQPSRPPSAGAAPRPLQPRT